MVGVTSRFNEEEKMLWYSLHIYYFITLSLFIPVITIKGRLRFLTREDFPILLEWAMKKVVHWLILRMQQDVCARLSKKVLHEPFQDFRHLFSPRQTNCCITIYNVTSPPPLILVEAIHTKDSLLKFSETWSDLLSCFVAKPCLVHKYC